MAAIDYNTASKLLQFDIIVLDGNNVSLNLHVPTLIRFYIIFT